jgi:hypothetical protein
VLEPIEQAVLVVIDNLTRGTLESTDGQAIANELTKMGTDPPNRLILGRLISHLKDEGYLKDSTYISAGGAVFVELNGQGREQAGANADPFQEGTPKLDASSHLAGSPQPILRHSRNGPTLRS